MKRPADVFVLKSPDYRASERAGDGLPYRIDLLTESGLRVDWSDAIHRQPWAAGPVRRAARVAERVGAPFLQTTLAMPRVARAQVILAMFESEGHFVAWLRARRLWPGGARLVVVTCWLAELLPGMAPRKVALYRRIYQAVDRVLFFSSNQGPILASGLALPPDRLRFVPFGVDETQFRPTGGADENFVLVAGRDKGRDWLTTFEALRGTGLAVKVLCRPADLAGHHIPDNVEVLGYVDRRTYRALLDRARVVLVATGVRAYPTGQSVALEAMAAGKACVVTETPATADYLFPSVNALAVPPGDVAAVRAAVVELMAGDELRARLGRDARRLVEERFTARAMWGAVASELKAVAGPPTLPG